MANEVDKTKTTAVGQSFDYGDMAHAGFEDTTVKDLSIPFINVMQSISPEVEDQTIPGVKAGDLVNSVTREIMKQPLCVIPIEKEEVWVEWVPRAKGGGLAGRHLPDSDVVKRVIAENGGSRIPPKDSANKRIPFSVNGNDLIETHYVYCLIINEEGTSIEGYCVLSFSSAKIRTYKDWMTALYTQKGRPPIFANRAKIGTEKVKNEQGTFFIYSASPLNETWRASLINPSTDEGQALLKESQEFRQMIQDGLMKPAYDTAGEETSDVSGGGRERSAPGKGSKGSDDEIPF